MPDTPAAPVAALAYKTLHSLCYGIVFGCYLGSYLRLSVVPLFARSLGVDAVQVGVSWS